MVTAFHGRGETPKLALCGRVGQIVATARHAAVSCGVVLVGVDPVLWCWGQLSGSIWGQVFEIFKGKKMEDKKELVSPYSLSTFGKAYTEFAAMKKLMDCDGTDVECVREQWGKLQAQLSNLFLLQQDGDGTLSFMNDKFTGMAAAQDVGLTGDAATTWDKLRAVQGLHMHLQMWLLISAHFLVGHPHMADIFNYNANQLIHAITDTLNSNDSLPIDVEPWAEAVINTACEEFEAENNS